MRMNRNTASALDIDSPTLTQKERLTYAKDQVAETFKKVFPYILIGVGIGAVIHNWIPESWVVSVLGSSNPVGVILATVIGVPMYADIFGTIPIAEALLAKGAQLGTQLHDGRDNAFSTVHDYATQGSQAEVAGFFHCGLHCRNHSCRLSV